MEVSFYIVLIGHPVLILYIGSSSFQYSLCSCKYLLYTVGVDTPEGKGRYDHIYTFPITIQAYITGIPMDRRESRVYYLLEFYESMFLLLDSDEPTPCSQTR
jgi:hypothetical protein